MVCFRWDKACGYQRRLHIATTFHRTIVPVQIGLRIRFNSRVALNVINVAAVRAHGRIGGVQPADAETREADPSMAEDLETVALRPMVVGGQVQTDDYEVVWRGLSVGWILATRQSALVVELQSLRAAGGRQRPRARHRFQGLPCSIQSRLDQDQAHTHRTGHRGRKAACRTTITGLRTRARP